MKKFGIILIIVVIVVIFLLVFLPKGKDTASDDSLTVSPTVSEIVVSVTEMGLVEPQTKVEIKSKVPGQVSTIFVDEGDMVQAGQVLLELDKTQYEYRVEQEKARHQEARMRLQFLEQTLARRQQEFNTKAISKHVLEEVALEKSLAEIEVRKTQLQWNAALDDLKYCQIRSSINGVVIQRGIELGEMVSPGVDATYEGKALLTIADLSRLLVKAELNQIDMSKIALEQQVNIRFDAFPDKQFSGVVQKVSPSASVSQQNIKLFPVEIRIGASADAGLIKPGMTADIEVLIASKKDVLTLPVEAVLERENERYVQRVREGKKQTIEEVPIVTGLENDRLVEIVSGITKNDKVLINPKSAKDNEMVI